MDTWYSLLVSLLFCMYNSRYPVCWCVLLCPYCICLHAAPYKAEGTLLVFIFPFWNFTLLVPKCHINLRVGLNLFYANLSKFLLVFSWHNISGKVKGSNFLVTSKSFGGFGWALKFVCLSRNMEKLKNSWPLHWRNILFWQPKGIVKQMSYML